MFKATRQLFSEDLSQFSAEEKYLNQEPNEVLYYIAGKEIVKSDSGNFFFAPLPDESKEFFAFGSQSEAANLTPATELDEKEREMMFNLNELNESIAAKGIFAVTMQKEKVKGKETVYAIITHTRHSENTYFKISVPELQALSKKQIDELLNFNEERTLSNPYCIQLDGDILLAY